MSETRTPYLVSGLSEGPKQETLLAYDDPNYCEPSWNDIRAVVQMTGLTGAEIAALVGVGARTVRKWVSPPESSNHTPMPYAPWRLLLIAAHLVRPPSIDIPPHKLNAKPESPNPASASSRPEG